MVFSAKPLDRGFCYGSISRIILVITNSRHLILVITDQYLMAATINSLIGNDIAALPNFRCISHEKLHQCHTTRTSTNFISQDKNVAKHD